MISNEPSEFEYAYDYQAGTYTPNEFNEHTYGIYEGPPPLQNVQYYKSIPFKDYSRDEIESLASRVGKVYEEHKGDRINPFTKEKIYSGVLALESGVIGGYILTSLSVALPDIVLYPALILVMTAFTVSYVCGAVFFNSLKKSDYYNPHVRDEVFQKIKMGNIKSLEKDIHITDLIEFDLASAMWSTTISLEEKVKFYLNLKKFIEESRSIVENYQKNIEALEADGDTVHELFKSFDAELQYQEFQNPLIKAKWEEWYREQRKLYRIAYTDAIGALEADFREYIEPYLVKNV